MITKVIATYLRSNPAVIIKLTSRWGSTKYLSYMKFLGINPFKIATNSSKFVALATKFNGCKALNMSAAKAFYEAAKSFGYRVVLHGAHKGYTYHFHLYKGNKKLNGIHVQIAKSVYDYFKKIL